MSFITNINAGRIINSTSFKFSSLLYPSLSSYNLINNCKIKSFHLPKKSLSFEPTLTLQGKRYYTQKCCVVSPMSSLEYDEKAEEFFDNLLEHLENIMDKSELKGFDVEYSNGVLTLVLGELGTYVINKQSSNKQIWSSSPVSGPRKYVYNPKENQWECLKDAKDDELRIFEKRLSKELSKLLKKSIEIAKLNC